MKKEFIVERNGRSFVLYAGLLDLAHERGLKAINTTLVQIPSDLNERTAIVHATVETSQGCFTGLGDASPDNVSRMMSPHCIRMAETRAKARALRDAVNVGVTALEELGELADDDGSADPSPPTYGRRAGDDEFPPFVDEDAAPHPAHVGVSPTSAAAARGEQRWSVTPAGQAPLGRQATGEAGAQVPSSNGSAAARPGIGSPATPKQLQTIQRMARAAGKTIATENLTRARASEIISGLIGEMDARAADNGGEVGAARFN